MRQFEMHPSAIIQLPLILNKIEFKKHVLMFDKMILIKENYDLGIQCLEMFAKKIPQIFRRSYNHIENNLDFLMKNDLLEFVSFDTFRDLENLEFEAEVNSWASTTDKMFFDGDLNLKDEALVIANYDKIVNFVVRLSATAYSYKFQKEAIPVIDHFEISDKTKRHLVYKFLLQTVPEPKDSVSWEQILDFKRDMNVQKKYYRLVNWINEVSNGELPINEIEEKYKELLFEYSDMFRIHKMRYKLGIVELITKIGSEIATLQFSKAHESFFSIFKQEVNLLEAESNFVGKQVAYIHKLRQNF